MQATTSPKVVDHRPILQGALAVTLIAAALAVGGAFGVALQGTAPAAPAIAGDYEASGLRNAPATTTSDDRFLEGAAFRRSHASPVLDGAVLKGAPTTGGLIWMGTYPGSPAGAIADDQMSTFNGYGLSQPDADESEKVGRAHR